MELKPSSPVDELASEDDNDYDGDLEWALFI